MRQRAGTEKALVKIATPIGDERQLRRGFHSLDNDAKVELSREVD